MLNNNNIDQIVLLGSSGYLSLSFIKYFYFNFENNRKKINLVLFSSNYKKILNFFKLNNIDYTLLDIGFYDYSEFEKILKNLKNYVIFNFSGYNIFKALFSFYSYNYKNKLIWSSRIDFTKKIINSIIKVGNYPLFFLLPSAVWIYSESKISDYFYQWENTLNLLKDNSYKIIFRLGVVLDQHSSWLKILDNFFFKFNLKPIFNQSLSFPFIYIEDVFKTIFDLITFKYKLIIEKLNIFDLFIYCKFNEFIDSFIAKNYSYKKFKELHIKDYLMEIFFKDYYKAMFLDYKNNYKNDKEEFKPKITS
jgi:hypothetical protein